MERMILASEFQRNLPTSEKFSNSGRHFATAQCFPTRTETYQILDFPNYPFQLSSMYLHVSQN